MQFQLIFNICQLTVQLDRLTNSGRETRKRQKLLQVQVRSLVEERADFLAQLQDQHREINALKRRLGIAEKENEDLVKGPVRASFIDLHAQTIVNHTNAIQQEIDDPHRARFSTAELKEILHERDDLKLHIGDLEEELKVYKPADEPSAEEKYAFYVDVTVCVCVLVSSPFDFLFCSRLPSFRMLSHKFGIRFTDRTGL